MKITQTYVPFAEAPVASITITLEAVEAEQLLVEMASSKLGPHLEGIAGAVRTALAATKKVQVPA